MCWCKPKNDSRCDNCTSELSCKLNSLTRLTETPTNCVSVQSPFLRGTFTQHPREAHPEERWGEVRGCSSLHGGMFSWSDFCSEPVVAFHHVTRDIRFQFLIVGFDSLLPGAASHTCVNWGQSGRKSCSLVWEENPDTVELYITLHWGKRLQRGQDNGESGSVSPSCSLL